MPRRTIVSPRFGVRLRELREERDLSLRELARKVPCSHVHISDMENRKKDPSPEMAVRLDEVLATGGELTALASATASPAEPWRPRADSFGRNDAEELAAALVAVTPTADNALRLAHEWLVAEPPQVYEARAGRRIGASTVAQVEHRVGQLRLLDDHIGGADTYAVVTKELVATGALLRETSFTAPVGKRLLVALGELAQLGGWVASDAGRHAEAEHMYLTGARAAHAGGDIPGAANNLSSLAYQLSNIGDSRDAVVLAHTAVRKAERVASATSRALLLERAAWAHAKAHEAKACERALREVGTPTPIGGLPMTRRGSTGSMRMRSRSWKGVAGPSLSGHYERFRSCGGLPLATATTRPARQRCISPGSPRHFCRGAPYDGLVTVLAGV